ncbi:SdrD B-like domain-containing protein [Amycolatopsis sp.]|uniref:SdrD B-like domain-containing protein n=1 Tax=Amycolatopsis sp. TaxID=37632 RepID=UPI002B9DB139|nr:SdrD B-like domain-containing protein [Amycolatopsis sp.]HVV10869.1 SdrD B-like domain-containing protein [Amycolatopsis sp.]
MLRQVVVAVVALMALGTLPVPAVADSTDGPLTVHVVRVDGDHAGVAGILVVATDPSGASASGTTGPDGTVVLPTASLSGGKYRVEAQIPASMPDVKPAPRGPGIAGLTEFVDVSGGKPAELTMGVGNGTGDVQLGDRVWFDTDGDGVQDGDEPGLPGVRVQLLACDGTGAPLAEKTTDAVGEYTFGPGDKLQPNTCYTVKFDFTGVNTAGLPGAPRVDGLKWTTPMASVTPAADSTVDPGTGTVRVTVGPPGSVDDTVDGGVVGGLNKIGDLVWADANRNGLQDPGEQGIAGVPVSLQTPDGKVVVTTTTGPHGQYAFSHLPDGTYKVCFDTTKLPAQYADYQLVKARAGTPGQDSAPDPGTGCTAPTELRPDRTEDLTMDAGLAPPVNQIAARVWHDLNEDGLRTLDEPGIRGVPVKLRTDDGTQIAFTTTGDDGGYLFDGIPDGEYEVCFDLANLPAEVADYTPAKYAGDSAANPATGCTRPVTIGLGKRVDTTLNAGLSSPTNEIGDRVWFDSNRNGLQDPVEPGVSGLPVKLVKVGGGDAGATTTGADGAYSFHGIPDGSYQVCFDTKTFPAGYAGDQWARPDSGDDALDSDVELATSCMPPVTVGVGHREVSTMDAGLVAARNRLGDLLWFDRNANGAPDPGEPGVPGVTVSMKDAAGKLVATTRTGPDGHYLLDDLPDGSYQVCFDLTQLPAEFANFQVPGKPDGCLGPLSVGPKPREDLSVRVGLVAPSPAVAPAAEQTTTGAGGGGFPLGWAAFTAIVVMAGVAFTVRWWRTVDQ